MLEILAVTLRRQQVPLTDAKSVKFLRFAVLCSILVSRVSQACMVK